MTDYIEISNLGEIELEGLRLMGASVKGENSIGFFGSGTKYAIATMLRNNINFKIYSGDNYIEITTEETKLRGQVFEEIIILGERTGLTTRMGINWELWFVLREFISNAMDEGEYKLSLVERMVPKEGYTKIFLEMTTELNDIICNLSYYIRDIDDQSVLDTVRTGYGKVEIIESEGEFSNFYRKGISITPNNTNMSLFWYNFDSIEINESRTYLYEHNVRERIASALCVTTDVDIIKQYLYGNEGYYESFLNWEYTSDEFSTTWYDLLKDKEIYPKSLVRSSEKKEGILIIQDSLAQKLAEQFKDFNIIGEKSKNYEILDLSGYTQWTPDYETEKDRTKIEIEEANKVVEILRESTELLSGIGYKPDFKIEIVKSVIEKDYWYEDNTMLMNINSIEKTPESMLKCYFYQEGYDQCSIELEDHLIGLLLHALKQLKISNR